MSDIIITPASGKIDFYQDLGAASLAKIELTSANDLSLSTTSGNLIIGDASRDIYIGNGINDVDIIFEQNGEIRPLPAKTLNIGTSGSFTQILASKVNINQNSFTSIPLDVYSSTSGATILNVAGTKGTLFSVTDNLSGSLMSINNDAGLPVFEVFSDDRVVAGRFGQNDFIMTSGGNVGIGTGVPSSKLHVVGTSTFNGDVSSTGSFIAGSGSAALPSFEFINDVDTGLFSPAANTFGISTSGVERLRINSSGNVGIGTASPASRLDVSGNIRASGLQIFSGGEFVGVAAENHGHQTIDIVTVTNSVDIGTIDGFIENVAVYGYGYSLENDFGGVPAGDCVSENNFGNVVRRDNTDGGFAAGTITCTGVIASGSFIAGSGSASNPSFEFINDPDTGLFSPAANTIGLATSGVERLRINNIGRVGIGTSTPSEALHVVGTGLFANVVKIGDGLGANPGILNVYQNDGSDQPAQIHLNNAFGTNRLSLSANDDTTESVIASTSDRFDITNHTRIINIQAGQININGSGVGLYDTSVFNLGTISGTNAINCGQDRQIQSLTLNGTATTFTKGTGWPSSSSVARETTLNIFSSGNTSITWTIVNDWYRQPDSPLPSGRHIVLLRSVGSGTMQGHYIGNKTN